MSSSKAEDHTNLQEGRPVDSGSEIPRQGRSPDFVLRGSALPGFPVVRTHTPAIWPVRRFLCRSAPDFLPRCRTLPSFPVYLCGAPVHSDGIAPDSHRIPFSPALRWTPWRYNFILFQTAHIITHIGKESTGEIDSFPRSAAAFPGENARKRESARRTQGPPGALGVPQEITA